MFYLRSAPENLINFSQYFFLVIKYFHILEVSSANALASFVGLILFFPLPILATFQYVIAIIEKKHKPIGLIILVQML